MKYKVEILDKSEKTYLISPKPNYCEEKFIKILSNYSYILSRLNKIPTVVNPVPLIFLFTNNVTDIKKLMILKNAKTRLIVILYSASNNAISSASKILKNNKNNVKIICIRNNDLTHQDTENSIWFGLSNSKEYIITYNGYNHPTEYISTKKIYLKKQIKITKKSIFFLLFLFIIFFHLSIIALYGISIFNIYDGYHTLQSGKIQESKYKINDAIQYSTYSKSLYRYIEPIYALFGIANKIESFLSIPEIASKTFIGIYGLEEHARFLVGYITGSQDLQDTDIQLVKYHINESLKNTDIAINSSTLLIQKLPSWNITLRRLRQKLITSEEALAKIKPLLENAEDLIGQSDEKKYLIFFFNNMELRPGGGFIGSYAIATFKDYRLTNLKVEDVYDADGQLKAHIEPPYPIKTYLHQPHWFLRDSNFDPDFLINTNQAFYFLEKEMGYSDFSGSIGITTTAIQYIIDSMGQIYVPDWQELITKDNFYIKTQIHAEKDFFPGSIQKKSFLNSLIRSIIQKIPETSYQNLAIALKKSLEEKQIVVYSVNPNIQNLFELSGWSGRRISPTCAQQDNNCILDFLFPYDANLGLNKANFYVKRNYELTLSFDSDNYISHNFKAIFTNDSPTEIFPGGTYGNYFQILIPTNTEKIYVLVNGKTYTNLDINTNANFKIIGLFFEVPPQGTKEIEVRYVLDTNTIKGKNMYQLIVQKQIGSMNNDLDLEIHANEKIHIINQNFSSLAKNDYLIYNTTLSNDKIFFIELISE